MRFQHPSDFFGPRGISKLLSYRFSNHITYVLNIFLFNYYYYIV